MVKWDLDNAGNPVLKQEFTRPAVYLDHWAIRNFAADTKLAKRFTAAIEARQGTWAVSMLNLMEFIKMTDETQAVQFERLLEQVLPNLFFIDFEAFGVMDRERAVLQRRTREAPYGDVSLLKVFAGIHPDTPRPFTVKSLVTAIVKHRDRLMPRLVKFNETIVDRIRLLRQQMHADEQLKKE